MSSSSSSCAFPRQHISGTLGGQPNPIFFFFTTWDQMKQCGITVSLPDGELRNAVAMAREMVKYKRLPHFYGRFLPGIERLMGRALAGVDEMGVEMGDDMAGGMAEKITGLVRGVLSLTAPKPIQILIFVASFLLFFGLTVYILVRFWQARNERKKQREKERERGLWVENGNQFEMVYVEGESGREEIACGEERLESEGEGKSEHLDWVKVESGDWNWVKGDGGKDVIVWREVQW